MKENKYVMKKCLMSINVSTFYCLACDGPVCKADKTSMD